MTTRFLTLALSAAALLNFGQSAALAQDVRVARFSVKFETLDLDSSTLPQIAGRSGRASFYLKPYVNDDSGSETYAIHDFLRSVDRISYHQEFKHVPKTDDMVGDVNVLTLAVPNHWMSIDGVKYPSAPWSGGQRCILEAMEIPVKVRCETDVAKAALTIESFERGVFTPNPEANPSAPMAKVHLALSTMDLDSKTYPQVSGTSGQDTFFVASRAAEDVTTYEISEFAESVDRIGRFYSLSHDSKSGLYTLSVQVPNQWAEIGGVKMPWADIDAGYKPCSTKSKTLPITVKCESPVAEAEVTVRTVVDGSFKASR